MCLQFTLRGQIVDGTLRYDCIAHVYYPFMRNLIMALVTNSLYRPCGIVLIMIIVQWNHIENAAYGYNYIWPGYKYDLITEPTWLLSCKDEIYAYVPYKMLISRLISQRESSMMLWHFSGRTYPQTSMPPLIPMWYKCISVDPQTTCLLIQPIGTLASTVWYHYNRGRLYNIVHISWQQGPL